MLRPKRENPENIKSEDVGGMLVENATRDKKLLENKVETTCGWNPVLNGRSGLLVMAIADLIQETTEKIIQIKQRMQAARDRQKRLRVDLKRKPMEFPSGDKFMLKVSPWKGVVRFGKRGKLNPRGVSWMRPLRMAFRRVVAFDLLRDALSAVFGLSELKVDHRHGIAKDALGYVLDCTLKD
ncbi:hypothetical protein Tco_1320375 [Tanacetum coccineum]